MIHTVEERERNQQYEVTRFVLATPEFTWPLNEFVVIFITSIQVTSNDSCCLVGSGYYSSFIKQCIIVAYQITETFYMCSYDLTIRFGIISSLIVWMHSDINQYIFVLRRLEDSIVYYFAVVQSRVAILCRQCILCLLPVFCECFYE